MERNRGAIVKCKVQLSAGIVRVSLRNGRQPEEVIAVLLSAAQIARAEQLQKLLVVSGHGDPASTETVAMALEQIHALGLPSPFKIAFVAIMLPQYRIYHFAERYAQKFGILAKVLVSIDEAKEWLGVREPSLAPAAQAAARQEATPTAA